MDWSNGLRQLSLILGLISIALALWGGTHLQHIVVDGGSRHVGETLVFIVLALVVFAGSWYGARQTNES